jgi:5-(carboxyamino)imidazole ribonucleotide mutase
MIGIVMGSNSDKEIMSGASRVLDNLKVSYDMDIVSAHRTPDKMYEYGKNARYKYSVIIAGAGGAAHLPGMLAALTRRPIIGVPIKSSNSLDGWDSILSILQMPQGTPVATVGLNAASNAALLAACILAINDIELYNRLEVY